MAVKPLVQDHETTLGLSTPPRSIATVSRTPATPNSTARTQTGQALPGRDDGSDAATSERIAAPGTSQPNPLPIGCRGLLHPPSRVGAQALVVHGEVDGRAHGIETAP